MDVHKFYRPVKADFFVAICKVCLALLKMAQPEFQATTLHGLPIPSKTSSASNTVKRHSLSIPALSQYIFLIKEAIIKTVKFHDANLHSQQSSHCFM